MNSQILGLTETEPKTLSPELETKLTHVRELLKRELDIPGVPSQSASSIEVGTHAAQAHDVCITCSFQAEDVLLLHLALELLPNIPVLFLDTGYHFAETYTYRDRIAADWRLNLINLIPANTVAQQEAEFGMLHQIDPGRCCQLRKVEPLFAAVANYRIWLTGLRREQARTRAALEETADFALPGGVIVRKLSPFADWTTRDVWQLCQHFNIPLLPLYDAGYSSIGCEPCTSIPTDPNDPRSGRWAGRKVECGIHIQPASTNN